MRLAALDEARLRLQRRLNLAAKETISQEILDNAELADTRIISPTNGIVGLLECNL